MQEGGLFIVSDLMGHGTLASAKGSPYFIIFYDKGYVTYSNPIPHETCFMIYINLENFKMTFSINVGQRKVA